MCGFRPYYQISYFLENIKEFSLIVDDKRSNDDSDNDGNEDDIKQRGGDEKSDGDIGSNKSDTAEEKLDFETWVRYHHGARPIKRLLIANNDISALKSIRCVHQWCHETFGDKNIIHFLGMATPEDTQSNAEYIRGADEVILVPGGANNYKYANVPLIVNIAKCDVVWPGWGHASENPALPRALKENGILWVDFIHTIKKGNDKNENATENKCEEIEKLFTQIMKADKNNVKKAVESLIDRMTDKDNPVKIPIINDQSL